MIKLTSSQWYELLKALPMTQQELGEYLGVSQPRIAILLKNGGGVRRELRLRILLEKSGILTREYRSKALLQSLATRAIYHGFTTASISELPNGLRLAKYGTTPNDVIDVVLGSPFKHQQVAKLLEQINHQSPVHIYFQQTEERLDFGYPTFHNDLCIDGRSYKSSVKQVGDLTEYTDFGIIVSIANHKGWLESQASDSRLLFIAGSHRIGTAIAANASFNSLLGLSDSRILQLFTRTTTFPLQILRFQANAERLSLGDKPIAKLGLDGLELKSLVGRRS